GRVPEGCMSDDPRTNIPFCPQCGASEWEVRVPRKDDKPRRCCLSCGYVHYVGPSLAAGIILHDGERYCLVRRAHEPGLGKWSFPGGFVDLDEDAADAAVREAREETGCTAEVDALLGIYNSIGPGGKRVAIAVYVGRVTGQCAANSEEVAAIEWFEPDAIPWDEFAFEATAGALRRYVDQRSERARKTS
ncbi:MAG: NUDIX hydrolase, partial [Planctomycetota bacterium]